MCLFVCLYVCLLVGLFVWSFDCLFVCVFVCVFACSFVHAFVRLFDCVCCSVVSHRVSFGLFVFCVFPSCVCSPCLLCFIHWCPFLGLCLSLLLIVFMFCVCIVMRLALRFCARAWSSRLCVVMCLCV